MAHFLPKGTLPAAPHVLASVQPRGTHRPATAPGAEVGTQEETPGFGWHHLHTALNSLGVMLHDVTAGDSDTP